MVVGGKLVVANLKKKWKWVNLLKKIFLVYTNSGAGHRRAAEALYNTIGSVFPEAEVKLVDTLDYATPVFKRTYPETYLLMVNRTPNLWGWSYTLLDYRFMDWLGRFFRRRTNALNCRRFAEWIVAEQPDLVITTHFLPNEIITALKKRGKFHNKLVTCITDYYPHAFWRARGVDLYITPNEDLAKRLGQLGVASNQIAPLGIPIDPVFAEKQDSDKLRMKLGLESRRFTILIASGGFGVGPIEELVREVLKIQAPIQVLVVCGNNEKLKESLTNLATGQTGKLHVYGFVHNMHELMSCADLMVTKSGGLTTSEAMAKGLPMIILYPIPGQEQSNCDFIVRHGAGKLVENPVAARKLIETLIAEPQQLLQLERNMESLARPESALNILKYIKERFDQGGNHGSKAGD